MVIPILNCILDAEEPEDIKDFVMHLEACINTEGDKGADCFSFRIMTPKRLEKLSEGMGGDIIKSCIYCEWFQYERKFKLCY